MSTCRDCISYDRCQKNYLMQVADLLNIDIDTLDKGRNKGKFNIDNDKVCEFFKDKSKIVELPCKVGDTLFFIDEVIELQGRKKLHYEVVDECIVDNIKIGQQMKVYVNACTKDNRWIMFSADDFGKTVFLTKEEAEKALRGSQDG